MSLNQLCFLEILSNTVYCPGNMFLIFVGEHADIPAATEASSFHHWLQHQLLSIIKRRCCCETSKQIAQREEATTRQRDLTHDVIYPHIESFKNIVFSFSESACHRVRLSVFLTWTFRSWWCIIKGTVWIIPQRILLNLAMNSTVARLLSFYC